MSALHRPDIVYNTSQAIPTRILVADDDRLTRRLLAHWLMGGGHEVVVVNDGTEALEALSRARFDVAVFDISMPRMGGMELLQRLRELDRDLPVVLVTAGASLPTALRGIELGVLQYMQKPLDRTRLLEVVGRGFELSRHDQMRRRLLDMVGFDDRELPDAALFSRALQALYVVFQPIVDLDGRSIYGYEALVRSHDPQMPGAGQLIDAAEKLDRLCDLGRRVRELAAEAFVAAAPGDARLFVNLHPSELHDEALYGDDDPLRALGERVVFEITERVPLLELDATLARIERLRQRGHAIAVDDLGAGYSCLTSFAALRPEVVKLDMALTRGIDLRPVQRRIVGALARLAEELDCRVVAEGVESAIERDILASLGCRLQQGYHYARPQQGFADVTWAP